MNNDGHILRMGTVPFGYLFSVAIVTWCTLFALAPVRRPRVLARVSFRCGFLLSEVPFIGVYWLAAATALAIGLGDVATAGGWVVVGLAALTMAGLAVVAWRGLRAGPAVERALNEGFGPGWRAGLDAGMSAALRHRLPFARILLLPLYVRRGDVVRVANIPYGDAGKRNLLDVYHHRSLPAGGPVLVHLHGGGLIRGRKDRETRPLIYRLAGQGWVCISANYRLSPSATFPDHLIDVKKVIAWVRAHGGEYGADPSLLFLAGSSAGGQLASLAAFTPNDPAFQPGFEHADTSVAAVISLYGYYGRLDTRERAPWSPLAYDGATAPPFFAIHGDLDTVVPVEDARLFVERLRSSSSNPVVYAELPGAQHTFDLFHSIRFDTVVDGIEAFAAWVRTREAARTPSGSSRPQA